MGAGEEALWIAHFEIEAEEKAARAKRDRLDMGVMARKAGRPVRRGRRRR